MMKEAQRLQKELAEAQKRIESTEIVGTSGGGMVSVTLRGEGKMQKLSLDDSLMDDREMLEDLIVAAYNDARAKLDQRRQEEMGSIGGMPPGLGFPL